MSNEGVVKTRVSRVHGPIMTVDNGRAYAAQLTFGHRDSDGQVTFGWRLPCWDGVRAVDGYVSYTQIGIDYITGHHRPNSPEVNALLSAHALAQLGAA